MSVELQKSSKRTIGISEVKQMALRYEGIVLSKSYVNARTPIMFKCKEGHLFKKRYAVIEKGSWCSVCNSHTGEAISRAVMNSYFECKFDQVRPRWLDGLELDGYNEDLKLAFEYDGVQHYKFIKRFHANEQAFRDQRERDKKKDALCKARGVRLIRIPYTVQNCDIPFFIKKELTEQNINIPNNVPVDYAKIVGNNSNKKEKMSELKQIVESRQGVMLSDTYVDMFNVVEVECDKGHKFSSNYYTLKYKKGWCGMCSLKSKFTIDELNYTLKTFDTRCINTEIKSFRSTMTFEHDCGEQWSSTISNIKKGERCPICFPETKVTRKRSIIESGESEYDNKDFSIKVCKFNRLYDKMTKIVAERGGEMMSETSEFLDRSTNLTIKCCNGHTFKKSYTNLIIQKTWCHNCGTKKKTIKDMHAIAEQYSGKCLSDSYSNNAIRLKWECENGHIFWRTPLLITTKKVFCGECNKIEK